jgi:hypothetical protein
MAVTSRRKAPKSALSVLKFMLQCKIFLLPQRHMPMIRPGASKLQRNAKE